MNCRVCGSELPDGAMFCGECGSSVTATRVKRPDARDLRPSDTTIIAPLPRPAVQGPRSTIHSVPVPQAPFAPETSETTGVVTEEQPSEAVAVAVTFAVSASTGEAITITGSGLLGRRPIPQPGEQVEQLVQIADEGRSVSKTHLEFGIEVGELWICDRYSANGTVIRPAEGEPRMCEPGRRYRVTRGSRVEIGDQFLDVN